ncbi:MAG: hypothetical protein AVDCRST_MAG02-680 [uncultured Rubrobacteraceae bacterium]|uniref:EthD domain-containing protein n=1 Tax=uncultured Rubrobacteraceae bacterium TaxID=349277 RepID=A0A6J4QNE7_9ACTN|nr:MAG: hypothetical protein AVDCRST_MAG02-680 [uncultured Rubrobacteraceae bacterium]
MIRFFSLIARREGVSPREFHDHWRHPHGTMGRLIPGLRSYVQAHQIPTDLLGPDQDEFEGVVVAAFDSADQATGLADEPQYVDRVQPDEPSFQDLPKNRFFSTDEEVLVPRVKTQDGAGYADALWYDLDSSVSIQLLQFVRPGGDPGWVGDDDAELGRRIGALRHARNRPSREVHGDDPPFLGARQLWWPTVTAFNEGVRGDPDAFRELVGRGGDSLTLLAQSERFLR